MNNFNTESLARAKRLIVARSTPDSEAAVDVERAITLELAGSEALERDDVVRHTAFPQHRYLTPFGATEACAKELHRAVEWYAGNEGLKAPASGKYNPLLATPIMFRGVTQLRQIADDSGIPYVFYVETAVRYWSDLGKQRIPRPSQLCSLDVAAHVMACWADPTYRYNQPLFTDDWDARFDADQYVGDDVQLAGLSLIDQRLDDARTLGFDPATTLGEFLDRAISREVAVDKYGSELVDRASQARDASGAEMAVSAAGILPVSADSVSKDADR